MKVGDVITEDKDFLFKSMRAGSVIRVIKGRDTNTQNNYVLRLSERAESMCRFGGVCILAPREEEIGELWGTSLNNYHYEIIKLT